MAACPACGAAVFDEAPLGLQCSACRIFFEEDAGLVSLESRGRYSHTVSRTNWATAFCAEKKGLYRHCRRRLNTLWMCPTHLGRVLRKSGLVSTGVIRLVFAFADTMPPVWEGDPQCGYGGPTLGTTVAVPTPMPFWLPQTVEFREFRQAPPEE
eukprot:Hpha_TRINITY_DN12102_c0_g1::TRINITY_DN12102_c0_g1_i2::g.82129::m.82129